MTNDPHYKHHWHSQQISVMLMEPDFSFETSIRSSFWGIYSTCAGISTLTPSVPDLQFQPCVTFSSATSILSNTSIKWNVFSSIFRTHQNSSLCLRVCSVRPNNNVSSASQARFHYRTIRLGRSGRDRVRMLISSHGLGVWWSYGPESFSRKLIRLVQRPKGKQWKDLF